MKDIIDIRDIRERQTRVVLNPTSFDDVSVITAPREIIGEGRNSFRDSILALSADRHVLIDMSQCGYLDSSGLGMLVALRKTLWEKERQLGLIRMNPDIATLIELTRIDERIFTAIDLDNNAVERLRAFQPKPRTTDEENGGEGPGLRLVE